MVVPDHPVTFTENGQSRTVDVSDEEYREGPPEVDIVGRTDFGSRSGTEKDKAWRRWLEAGHDLSLLEEARQAAEDARTAVGPPPPGVSYELPEIVHIRAKKVVYGKLGGPATAPLADHALFRIEFDVGPPPTGGAYDPSFPALTDSEKRTRWADWLEKHDHRPDMEAVRAQRRFLDAVQVLEARQAQQSAPQPAPNVPAPAEVDRSLDILRIPGFQSYPRTKWGVVLLGLLGTGIGFGVGFGTQTGGTAPGVPRDVRAHVTHRALSGNRVTVTWSAPDTGPAPTSYSTTLVPLTGTGGALRGAEADGASTSTFADFVPVATYLVRVVAVHDRDEGRPAEITVTVTAAPTTPPPTTTVPDPPTAVTLTEGLSATTGLRVLTAAWVPPAAGPAPDGYTVDLAAVTPKGMTLTAYVGLMTSWPFPGLATGTYRASVVATNANGASTAAPSPVTSFQALPPAPPDAPLSLTGHVSASRVTGGNAALVLTWDPPATGTEVKGYEVTLTGPRQTDDTPRRVGPMTSSTYDPISDDTWSAAVLAYNDAGSGDTATASIVVDHNAIDPNGLDWVPVFGTAQVAQWKTMLQAINTMDEQTEFWPHVHRVVEDTAGVHGGLASYPTMLFLARLLVRWIKVPAVDPVEVQIAYAANKISTGCSPDFPTAPPRPGREYTDRMAPWRAAMNIPQPIGPAQVVLRFKLFGLVRALERYLGVHP